MLCSFNTINRLPAFGPSPCLPLQIDANKLHQHEFVNQFIREGKKRITAYQRHICMSLFDTQRTISHANKTFAKNPFEVLREFGISNFFLSFDFLFILLTSRWVNFKYQHSYGLKKCPITVISSKEKKCWKILKWNQIFYTHVKYGMYVDWLLPRAEPNIFHTSFSFLSLCIEQNKTKNSIFRFSKRWRTQLRQ